jgi:hypothetical protein
MPDNTELRPAESHEPIEHIAVICAASSQQVVDAVDHINYDRLGLVAGGPESEKASQVHQYLDTLKELFGERIIYGDVKEVHVFRLGDACVALDRVYRTISAAAPKNVLVSAMQVEDHEEIESYCDAYLGLTKSGSDPRPQVLGKDGNIADPEVDHHETLSEESYDRLASAVQDLFEKEGVDASFLFDQTPIEGVADSREFLMSLVEHADDDLMGNLYDLGLDLINAVNDRRDSK